MQLRLWRTICLGMAPCSSATSRAPVADAASLRSPSCRAALGQWHPAPRHQPCGRQAAASRRSPSFCSRASWAPFSASPLVKTHAHAAPECQQQVVVVAHGADEPADPAHAADAASRAATLHGAVVPPAPSTPPPAPYACGHSQEELQELSLLASLSTLAYESTAGTAGLVHQMLRMVSLSLRRGQQHAWAGCRA